MSSPEDNIPAALHIVELRSENVKRLRAVTIRPDGHIITIGGDNDQGKSSVLQSIEMAIGGGDHVIDEPIRRGAKKARTVLDLGELIVTRTFTKSGSSLVVTGKDGTPKKSPQELLNKLATAVTFDPFGFTELDDKRQAQVLRELVKLDFTLLDSSRLKAFNERTLINRDLDQQKALVARLPFHDDAPAEEESSAEVLTQIEAMRTHNDAVAKLRADAEDAAEEVLQAQNKHEDMLLASAEIRDQIRALQDALAASEKKAEEQVKVLAAARQKHADAEKAAKEVTPLDATPLKAKLSGLEAANAKVRANKQRADAEAAMRAKQQQADALTKRIEDLDEQKAAALRDAKFPVDGLSFTEDGVLLDGLPFNQAGDAEQIRVSVAIAAALNPRIRVMLIRDGSLIGTKKMELIAKLAKEHNLQVWIEVVSDKDDKKSSVVIEDGHVVGQEVEPDPAPEAETPGAKVVTTQGDSTLFDIPPSR